MQAWWTKPGAQSEATGEDEPSSLSPLLVPVIPLVSPPAMEETSSKLQAVTPWGTWLHGGTLLLSGARIGFLEQEEYGRGLEAAGPAEHHISAVG